MATSIVQAGIFIQLQNVGVKEQSKTEKGHYTSWKLADFGIAKMLTREAQEQYYGGDAPGVPTYMGPEVLRDFETYSAASDVWSLGCVIAFFMRNGKHVFNCNDDVLYFKPRMASDMIFDEESTNNYSSTIVQLVCSMIQVNLSSNIDIFIQPIHKLQTSVRRSIECLKSSKIKSHLGRSKRQKSPSC